MKKTFSKLLAGVTASVIALSLVIGAGAFKKASAVEGTEVSLVPWSIFEGAEIGRSKDPDGWPTRTYNAVTTTAGETQNSVFWNTGLPHQQYVDSEPVIWQTTEVADGFTADIAGTGWDGDYSTGPLTGDNPYLLRADMQGIQAQEGHMYTVSFTASWTNRKNAPEKNIQVGVQNAYGESVFKDEEDPVTKVTVTSGTSKSYSQDFTLWAGNTLDVQLAYGAFFYSFNQGLTTENVAAEGDLVISDFKIIDNGQDPRYETAPQIETDTQAPVVTTKKPTPETQPPVVKKLGKVTGLKVKNTKKKTIKVSFKKVANAKKYQIKVGSKSFTTSAAKKTIKNKIIKKGKKITVKVRATAAGYTAGAWASKKIKIKK